MGWVQNASVGQNVLAGCGDSAGLLPMPGSARWAPPCMERAACCPCWPTAELGAADHKAWDTRGLSRRRPGVGREGGHRHLQEPLLGSGTGSCAAPAGALLSPPSGLRSTRGWRGAAAGSGRPGSGAADVQGVLSAWNPRARVCGSLARPRVPGRCGRSPCLGLPPLPLPGPLLQAGVQPAGGQLSVSTLTATSRCHYSGFCPAWQRVASGGSSCHRAYRDAGEA